MLISLPRESLLTPPDHTPVSSSTELTNMTDTAQTTYPVHSGDDEEEDLEQGSDADSDSNTSSSSSSSTDQDHKDSENEEEDTELKKQEESENFNNVTHGGHYNKTSSMKTTRIILPRESDISVPREYHDTMIIKPNNNIIHHPTQSSLWTVTTPLTADSQGLSHANFRSVTQLNDGITPDLGTMGGVYGDMFGINNHLHSSDDDVEETEEAPLSPNI